MQRIYKQIGLIQNEKYAVIAANYQGVIIAEITEDKQLKFVSKATVVGNCFRILQFEGDQYVLVTSYENPAISLISISDIKNPRVIQRIGDKSLFAYYQMCISEDKTELFVTGQYALFHYQIQTSVILHTQTYLLISKENSNEFNRYDLEQSSSLKIGQLVEMHLVPIYQSQDIILKEAYYYEEFVLQDLPKWMSFFPTEKILRINVSKDSLKKNDQGEYIETVQQVVFLAYQSLSNTAFINTYLNINKDDSISIFNACQIEGYIDPSGFIQATYTPTKQLNLGANEKNYLSKWVGDKFNLVKRFLQYVLNQNIVNYTTQFKIAHSLFIDLNNSTQYIQTLQEDVVIKIVILEKIQTSENIQTTKARFVKKSYSGILVLLSDKQDEIKLEGSLKNINQVLKEGIKFSLNELETNTENIYMQLTVSDNVNYNYENIFQYSKLPFLSLQSQISVSPSQNLQNDLLQKYPKGEIYIQESFSYQISTDVFQSKDESRLQYTALLKRGEEYKEIPKDFWLQFSPTDRVFTGVPTSSQYNEKTKIQVNATDGYTYKIDEFEVTPNKIPFNYAFQIAIQIIGPLFGLLGLYRFKHNHYVYTKEIAYVGEFYRKQIVITDNKRPIALKLWKFFLSRINIDQIKYQLANELSKPSQANSFQYYNPETDIEQTKQIRESSQFQEEIIKKIYPYGISNEDCMLIDKKMQNILLFNSENIQFEESKVGINQSVIHNNVQNHEKEQSVADKFFNQSQIEKSQTLNKSVISRTSTLRERSKSQPQSVKIKFKQAVQTLQKQVRLKNNSLNQSQIQNQDQDARKFCFFEEPIFDNDGKINLIKILKFIEEQQNYLPHDKKDVSQLELKQLNNENSILSQAIYCLLVEYLLNLCPSTKNILDYMKSYALIFYKEIDWYKAYLNITPQFNDVHTHPYPKISIHQQSVNAALSDIFKQMNRYHQSIKSNKQKQIVFSLMLIEENLKAKAIGFSQTENKFIQSTRGESLHAYSHMVHSVKAYEKNNSINCCFNLYEKLDLHYQQKGLTDNDKLPLWIQGIDLINGTICFGGIPDKRDVGSIIIKIFHQEQFILRSFEIQILQKESDILRQKNSTVCNITERQHSNSYYNSEIDQGDSSQHMFKKKKSLDFTQFAKQTFRKKSFIDSHRQSILSGSFSPRPTDLRDEIIEEKSEKEIKNQNSQDNEIDSTPEKIKKTFRLIGNKDSIITTDIKFVEQTPGIQNTLDTQTNQMCKVTKKERLNKPTDDEESILSIQD